MKLGYPFNLDTLVILEPEGVCNKEPTTSGPFREETNFVGLRPFRLAKILNLSVLSDAEIT